MDFIFRNKKYNLKRYPSTENKSLRQWSAADEYMLNYISENDFTDKKIALYNDRFAFLDTVLSQYLRKSFVYGASQLKAIKINRELNNIPPDADIVNPFIAERDYFDIHLIKIPKSLDLFRLFLIEAYNNSKDDSVVICSFMTKYFSSGLLDVAKEYFEEAEQSLAWKKSRLFFLKGKKSAADLNKFNAPVNYKGFGYKQYLGVFSAKHIDYATQFLLENLELDSQYKSVLDLASGNGVIARAVQEELLDSHLFLMDESLLAIESSKFNVDNSRAEFVYSDSTDVFESDKFDLILSNPPFHIEHENNIEVSLNLFEGVKRVLKPEGKFVLVANIHLNYKTHLDKLFNRVEIVNQNDKFVIYSCKA